MTGTTNNEGSASEYTGGTPTDTINGWNDRRKSNNQVISGLTPFVQMIGLFNPEEYEKMFSTDTLDRRSIEFTDAGGHDVPLGTPYNIANVPEGDNFADWIDKQLRSRFINIYLVEN